MQLSGKAPLKVINFIFSGEKKNKNKKPPKNNKPTKLKKKKKKKKKKAPKKQNTAISLVNEMSVRPVCQISCKL